MCDSFIELMNKLECGKKKIEKLEKIHRNLVLFGTGNTSVLYQKCFATENIRPIMYVDNNKSKQNNLFYGCRVCAPSQICKLDNPLVLIVSWNKWMIDSISKQLDDMGVEYMGCDEYIISNKKDEILNAIKLLEDDKSKDILCRVILSRITNNQINEEICDEKQYFSPFMFKSIDSEEVFVDMGAFVGDTLEQYLFRRLGCFDKVYAFEPDSKNFRAMQYRVARLNNEWALNEDRIKCIQAGVGQKTENIRMNVRISDGASLGTILRSSGDEGQEETECHVYSLDDFFVNQKVSFIKADIESFELDMLKGAEQVIRRDNPLIAIAIYHSPSDFYEIIKFLEELNLGYKFMVRHHSNCFFDTVLYAYTKEYREGV